VLVRRCVGRPLSRFVGFPSDQGLRPANLLPCKLTPSFSCPYDVTGEGLYRPGNTRFWIFFPVFPLAETLKIVLPPYKRSDHFNLGHPPSSDQAVLRREVHSSFLETTKRHRRTPPSDRRSSHLFPSTPPIDRCFSELIGVAGLRS